MKRLTIYSKLTGGYKKVIVDNLDNYTKGTFDYVVEIENLPDDAQLGNTVGLGDDIPADVPESSYNKALKEGIQELMGKPTKKPSKNVIMSDGVKIQYKNYYDYLESQKEPGISNSKTFASVFDQVVFGTNPIESKLEESDDIIRNRPVTKEVFDKINPCNQVYEPELEDFMSEIHYLKSQEEPKKDTKSDKRNSEIPMNYDWGGNYFDAPIPKARLIKNPSREVFDDPQYDHYAAEGDPQSGYIHATNPVSSSGYAYKIVNLSQGITKGDFVKDEVQDQTQNTSIIDPDLPY